MEFCGVCIHMEWVAISFSNLLKVIIYFLFSASYNAQLFFRLPNTRAPGHHSASSPKAAPPLLESVFPAVSWVVDSKAFKGPGCTGTPLSRQLLGKLTAGGSIHRGLSQPLWDSVPLPPTPSPAPQCKCEGVIWLSESQMLGSLNGFQKLPSFAATVEKISFFVIFKEKQAVMLFEV